MVKLPKNPKRTNGQYGIEVTVHALFKQGVKQNPTIVERALLDDEKANARLRKQATKAKP